MRLRNYFPLQLIVLGILAIMLIPKTVSSCCSFKAGGNNKTEAKVVVAETTAEDLRDELLFRY